MEPRIQYAKTKDGVSIAFASMGEGPPLVFMPSIPFSHTQLELQIPEWRRWYERLAQRSRLVRYDFRGQGLSDHDVTQYSLDAWLLDLEAVVDHLGLERFALLAMLHAGPVAITYASRRPERISHLILWCTYARASDYLRSTQAQTMRSLALSTADWELYTETVAHAVMGWGAGAPARQLAGLLRESATQEAAQAALRVTGEFDVARSSSEVRSPTLVVHRRQVAIPDVDAARALASQIPDARLAILEGKSIIPLGERDRDSVVSTIDEFLGEGEEAEPTEPGGFRTVLFTDVEGSTALTDRLGDARARELLREHERMVREALESHGGSEVKALGDGFMTSFSSAVRALECAIAMQRAFAEHNQSAEEPILVRVGLNAGEPIAEDDPDGRSDLYGTAVNLAARITAQGKGGEILASEAVRQIVAGKKFPFSDRGETTLRGFEDPVHVYEVSWRESA
jgi:class 3 adenylate cyclase/pimeloyl-ACP methyl ester carboxylesterase